jgi:hypothetical protein
LSVVALFLDKGLPSSDFARMRLVRRYGLYSPRGRGTWKDQAQGGPLHRRVGAFSRGKARARLPPKVHEPSVMACPRRGLLNGSSSMMKCGLDEMARAKARPRRGNSFSRGRHRVSRAIELRKKHVVLEKKTCVRGRRNSPAWGESRPKASLA